MPMSDYLAWSTSTTLTLNWPYGGSAPTPLSYPSLVTLPATADLGLNPTLVYAMFWRVDRDPGTNGFDYHMSPTITLGGTNVVPDFYDDLGFSYGMAVDGSMFPDGLKASGSRFGYWRNPALASGGPVNISFNLSVGTTGLGYISGWTWHMVFAFCLFRDVQLLPSLVDPYLQDGTGAQAGSGYTYPGGGSLSLMVAQSWFNSDIPRDPGPAEVVYVYDYDTYTSTSAPSVTGETVAGWEDAIMVSNGSTVGLVGLYVPTDAVNPTGLITGVTSGTGHGRAWLMAYSMAAVQPHIVINDLADTPTKLYVVAQDGGAWMWTAASRTQLFSDMDGRQLAGGMIAVATAGEAAYFLDWQGQLWETGFVYRPNALGVWEQVQQGWLSQISINAGSVAILGPHGIGPAYLNETALWVNGRALIGLGPHPDAVLLNGLLPSSPNPIQQPTQGAYAWPSGDAPPAVRVTTFDYRTVTWAALAESNVAAYAQLGTPPVSRARPQGHMHG